MSDANRKLKVRNISYYGSNKKKTKKNNTMHVLEK